MKARLSSPLPKVAAGVNIPQEKAEIIAEVMAEVGGKYTAAANDCGADSVGYVCGLSGYIESTARTEVTEELLIFSGLDSKDLNKAVTMLRSKGCDVPLKAMVTPHNRDWTVSALAGELAREHEYMNSRGKRENDGQE
ncbi:MAG: DUF3783 domain-containing protein [Ruminococcus sp.]|uniref:DUF3783 domain-containing protein n=1 Tax=Ruminococcus sp. TaxID=41978 RepID=UPI0025F0720A|nr:DUF3783 domain-containing protein [Ruminococcus sp.]MBO4866414.1 DUF3783 domain-containing protein [Ruminococcus sp.]